MTIQPIMQVQSTSVKENLYSLKRFSLPELFNTQSFNWTDRGDTASTPDSKVSGPEKISRI
jgi:hypothetical protein